MESPKFYRSLSVALPSEAGGRLPVTVGAQPTVGALGRVQGRLWSYAEVFSSSLSIAFGREIPI